MKSVYLAGPVLGLDYSSAVDWREHAKEWLEKLGITGFSPMRFKNYLAGERKLRDNYGEVLCTPAGLVTRDRNDVISCNVLLANLLDAKRISIGTMIEYGWADAFRKPIITVMEKEGNPHEHAFVRELTGFRVETLEEGLSVAKAILSP